MLYVLFNLRAGNCYEEKIRPKLVEFFKTEEMIATNVVDVDDKRAFMEGLSSDDILVLVGGDGTLNRFVNAIDDKEYPFPIYCYAGGSGNDFVHDIADGNSDELVKINDYIHRLPKVYIKGNEYKFMNGIGFGIDDYCCEVGDKYKEKTGGKAPNYTKIALKGLFGAFKTVKATVVVDDGEEEKYENVWMVPTMKGRYFGGGMKITPDQNRLDPEHLLSVAVVKSKWRLRILTIFPKIFKGDHVKYTKTITIRKCKSVTVTFDKPTALQVDGETVLGVTTYTAKSYALIENEAKEPATV
jgi:diacylglycerol kinase family enzyme